LQRHSFSYDEDRLLVGAGDLTLTRDPNNGLLTGTSIGSLNDTWTYNTFAEPLSYAATYGGPEVFNQQDTSDDVGRIAQKSEAIAGVTSQFGYGYDTAGRLIDVTKNGTNTSHYTYDENGNRLTRTTAGEGLGVGVERYTDGKNINGINVSAGPSARTPTPFELHSVAENTWVTTLSNVWTSIEDAFAGADNAVRNALTGYARQ
jgi:YD repeat-containing protein